MENINKHIEHTLLKQDAKKEDFIKLFNEAKEHKFLGVCVNPAYVSFAKKELDGSDVKVVTVVGFPLGANLSEVKAYETKQAIEDGADEIDMVINVSALKDKDYDYVKLDIATVKAFCEDKPLKVILETDLLDKDEIKKAYRKMSKKYHPDLNKEEGAEEKYKEFESAFVNRQIGKFINGNKKIIRSGNVTGKIIGTNLGCMMYLLSLIHI